jgi:predicted Fe-S protein YdhL (DUF1289 family)
MHVNRMIPVALLVLGAATVIGTKSVSAYSPSSRQTIIQKVAARFGLSRGEAQHKVPSSQNLDEKVEAVLTKDVKDQKITEEQKQIILAKYRELKSTYTAENWQSMSREERVAVLESEKAKLQAWAAENELDVMYLLSKVRQLRLHRMKWK